MMIAEASGDAASTPSPPNTSQVSLSSHTGAVGFITTERSTEAGPHGGAGIHQNRTVAGGKPVQHADAEIKAVEYDVIEDGEPEQDSPQRHQVEHHRSEEHTS